MIWKAAAMATGDWQLHHNNVPAQASRLVQSFLVKHQVTQVTQAPSQPIFGTLRLLPFPKTEITFEREEVSGHRKEIQEDTTGQLMVKGRTV